MTNVEAGLDLEMVWVIWACPACELVAEQHINNVGFGMDMDLRVNLEGHCEAYLEVICPHCSKHITRKLSKES